MGVREPLGRGDVAWVADRLGRVERIQALAKSRRSFVDHRRFHCRAGERSVRQRARCS